MAIEVRGPESARAVLPPGRGRGSAVSSIVCYLTGLSHVDPVKAELFPGRFLNEEVTAAPDIDLDFPRDIRAMLIPRIHERYGRDRSALVAAFPTYRSRGAIRELRQGARASRPPRSSGPPGRVDFHGGSDDLERDLAAAVGPERAALDSAGGTVWLSEEARGLPRHASQHSGGMIDLDRPLIDICPVVPAAMEGRQIVQWDKDSCEDAGFLKIDLLGLGHALGGRALASTRSTGSAARRSTSAGSPRRRADLRRRSAGPTPPASSRSRAAPRCRSLPRTRPMNIDDLTVQVALVRPGPIQGGAVHPYIERRAAAAREPRLRSPVPAPIC